MKNYFIANGEVLNTNMGIEEMEITGTGVIGREHFRNGAIQNKKISEKEVGMFFVRDFDYAPDAPIIFDADMALISGVGIGAFQPQQVGGYPMIYPLSFAGKNFYTGITSFIRFYKFQLFEETGADSGAYRPEMLFGSYLNADNLLILMNLVACEESGCLSGFQKTGP